jgi:hypothetical protein
MSATTNPTPEEVLEAFRDLGTLSIPLSHVTSVHVRILTARGVHLAGHIGSSEDQDEFDAIEQELANRVMGRVPFLK